LFILAVGTVASPERLTPAIIRAEEPSLRLPAGMPTCALAPHRYSRVAVMSAAFAPSAPAALATAMLLASRSSIG
jgi:hypothetical protein